MTPSHKKRRPSNQGKHPAQKQDALIWKLKKPVFFIGFMGAGKSTVARKLARRCRIPSIDVDVYLERREGKSIKDIFADAGEEAFRDIETEVLREIAAEESPRFISCGGGIITRPENRQILQQEGYVVYLKVSAKEAASRISNLQTRPLFNDITTAQQTNEQREPLYRESSHVVIDTAGKSIGQLTSEVQRLLQKEGILWQPQK